MADYIDETFGPGGFFAKAFPNYEPREGQIALARQVDRSIRNCRSALVEGPTGCHVAGQGILMHNGSIKRVEDIEVGNLLQGPDGEPRRVLALARGEQETATIRPTKGEPWTVNVDHILTLVRTDTGSVVDVRVRDWLRWSKTQKHLHKLFRAPATFVSYRGLVDAGFLDPYFLGVLLGDGSLAVDNGVHITKPDPEIRALCEEQATRWGLRVRTEEDGQHHHIVGSIGNKGHAILHKLRALSLLPVASEKRFVPVLYKTGSMEERLAVLAGLLDTDGSLTGVGCYDFISKSPQLANDVAFIARSVGLAAYVTASEKSCGEFRGTYYRVSISGETHKIPCRIPRKKAPQRRQKKDALRTGFTVELTGKVEPYFGFSLDGDGRYLLDDFTVTHNTGKSVGYLVPCIFHLFMNGPVIVSEREEAPPPLNDDLADLDEELKGGGQAGEEEPARALIATANIALQEQLIQKDVPLLQRILPWPFKAAIAKGKGNYLCLDRFDDSVAEIVLEPLRDYEERRQWTEIAAWAGRTATGDFSELPFEIKPTLRPKLAVTADDCLGKGCPRREDCHAEKAKRAFKGAQIIITNYHMLFAHLALAREGASILPKFDIVIMDEAHEAADIARDFFGFRVTAGSIRHAARLLVPPKNKGKKGALPEIDRELKSQIDELADRFFGELREHRRSPKYFARIRDEKVAEHEQLGAALLKASTLYQGMADNGAIEAARRAELRRAARRAKIVRGNIEAAMLLEGALTSQKKGGNVYFIEEEERANGQSRVTLCSRPLDVAPLLREHLFEAVNLRCAVAASATLATGKGAGAFDFAAAQLGAEAADELLVESPFDHQRQALLVLPKDAPDPSAKDYADKLAPLIVRAVEAAEGRTLGLFTSRKGLRIAAEALRVALGDRYVILVQGEAPRTQLVQRFREDVSSVLLGTKSFWAGVDVPGEALSCVLVDRIPFDPPDDPILDALSERSRETFTEYSIPRATVELRQGFGRLIRSRTDRGVVVLFDARLVKKGYGKRILRAMPDAPISNELEDIGTFLRARAPARRRSAAGGAR